MEVSVRTSQNFPHLDEDAKTKQWVNRERFIQDHSFDARSRQDSKEIVSRLLADLSIILTIVVHHLDHHLDHTCHKQGQPSFDTWLFFYFIGTHLHTDSWQNNPNIPRTSSTSFSGCTSLWGPWWDNFLKADQENWSNAFRLVPFPHKNGWRKAERDRGRQRLCSLKTEN